MEVLKAVVILRRSQDDKDFPVSQVICYPTSEADRLEEELKNRRLSGALDMVLVGRGYVDMAPNTPIVNEVDSFLERIDSD